MIFPAVTIAFLSYFGYHSIHGDYGLIATEEFERQRVARQAELEALTEEPLFQYIVTTTTRPPEDVGCFPWLRLTLRGSPGPDRLLGQNL